eukprot:1461777-Pyramimonas_sp.AAC.1
MLDGQVVRWARRRARGSGPWLVTLQIGPESGPDFSARLLELGGPTPRAPEFPGPTRGRSRPK